MEAEENANIEYLLRVHTYFEYGVNGYFSSYLKHRCDLHCPLDPSRIHHN